jgi:DNA-binding MarR family transcriptional regulator
MASPRDNGYLDAERDARDRLEGLDLDVDSNMAISNIYRAAAAVRVRAERDVLASQRLSWGGLTILWVLWVWGDMATSRLADECGLAKGTLTGMLTTLEKRDLVARHRLAEDKRKVMVRLTALGQQTISELFPTFNGFETTMVSGLTAAELQELARLLRIVIVNASADER